MMQKSLTLKQSQELATTLRCDADGHTSVSLYSDATATDKEIANAMEMLSSAFQVDGERAGGFYLLLAKRIKANGFTGRRLADAVAHLLDNHKYKTITIADVVGYDRRRELLTYRECLAELARSGQWRFEFVGEINGKKYWSKKD